MIDEKIIYSNTTPDAKAYFALFNTTGWNEVLNVRASEFKKVLENSWHVMTAYDTNKLVGIGRIVSDGVLYAMIYDLIVAPSHQGRGIGTKILNSLIHRCLQAGIRQIQMFSAKGKAGFYSKHGFVERPLDAPGMNLSNY